MTTQQTNKTINSLWRLASTKLEGWGEKGAGMGRIAEEGEGEVEA